VSDLLSSRACQDLRSSPTFLALPADYGSRPVLRTDIGTLTTADTSQQCKGRILTPDLEVARDENYGKQRAVVVGETASLVCGFTHRERAPGIH
jgi:hypothetical protein